MEAEKQNKIYQDIEQLEKEIAELHKRTLEAQKHLGGKKFLRKNGEKQVEKNKNEKANNI